MNDPTSFFDLFDTSLYDSYPIIGKKIKLFNEKMLPQEEPDYFIKGVFITPLELINILYSLKDARLKPLISFLKDFIEGRERSISEDLKQMFYNGTLTMLLSQHGLSDYTPLIKYLILKAIRSTTGISERIPTETVDPTIPLPSDIYHSGDPSSPDISSPNSQ